MRRLLVVLTLSSLAPAALAQSPSMITAHASGLALFPTTINPVPMEMSARAMYRAILQREASMEGLPIEVADAVTQIESGYNASAIGEVGEIGLMQVRPATAVMLGFKGSTAELAQPEVNIRYGVRYLAEAWRLTNGDLCRTLMKYRAGHGSETMSLLSVAYCARAQVLLKISETSQMTQGPTRSVSKYKQTISSLGRLPKGLKRGTPEFRKVFWAMHEARIAMLRERVHAKWRARSAHVQLARRASAP